jgi:hypothetical protein
VPYQDAAGKWYQDDGSPMGYGASGFEAPGSPGTPFQFVNTAPNAIPAPPTPGSSMFMPVTPSIPGAVAQWEPGIVPTPPPTDTAPPPPPPPPPPASTTQIFGAQPPIPSAPGFNFPAFQTPTAFALPSGADVLKQDPGYDFRVKEGLGALGNAFGPMGLRTSGQAGEALTKYAGDAASQEYQNAADRAASVYNMNFSNALQAWLANAGNALTTYNTNYNTQYQNPYLAAVGQFATNAGLQNQLFNQRFATATA